MLTLAEALESGRLQEFIAQAESQGFGIADETRFNALVSEASKERPPSDQTSRSRGSGGLRGK